METIQNEPLNRCEEVLAHDGVKGMHWYIRRYQPYPSGYDGEGKFVGKRAARKAAKIEKRQARHQAKVKKKIENAVDTGNKKSLNKLRDEMSSDEYDAKYKELVDKGIDNAVKDRDTGSLKKFKEDMSPREYKHQKDRIEFKEAIDNDKNKKANKLLSKVDPEDVAEATNLIKSRVALQDQKLAKIRQDSELMAKMDKLASGIGKVSKIAQNASSITSSVMSVNKQLTEFSKSAGDAEKKKKEKELEKIIRSGDLDKIRKAEKDMSASQLSEAYDRIIQSGNEREIRKAAPYMDNKQITAALQKLKQMDELKKRKDPDSVDIPIDDPESTPTADASRSAPVQAVRDWIDSGFAASSDRMSSSDRHRFLINQSSAATTVGEARTIVGSQMSSNVLNEGLWWNSRRDGSYSIAHSDDISYEDVLAHHGILGMHWGIRRFQPYPKGYKGDGKEVGEAKRVSRSDRKYQNYDVSYAKAGSQYRKKTKYTNIDGSLNEKGKLHAQKYISKQIEKNEKYYAKEIAKYEKKAEKYKDTNPEMSKKFKDMAKDAARSRDGVNRSIKEMAIDEIMTNESLDNARVMKAIKTAAGVTVGAATGGAVLAGGLGLSSALSTSENFARAKQQAAWELNNAKAQFKLSEPVDSFIRISNTSEIGKKAESVVENTIRTYSDARAYVVGIGLDQAVNRMGWINQQYGTTDKIAKIAGGTGKAALNEMGFTPQTISDLNTLVTNTGNVANSVLSNPNVANTANQILNNPNTANYISQLSNAGVNVPMAQQTLGTKAAIDEIVASAPAAETKSAVTRAYIKSQPNTLTAEQQEYYRKHNVG